MQNDEKDGYGQFETVARYARQMSMDESIIHFSSNTHLLSRKAE